MPRANLTDYGYRSKAQRLAELKLITKFMTLSATDRKILVGLVTRMSDELQQEVDLRQAVGIKIRAAYDLPREVASKRAIATLKKTGEYKRAAPKEKERMESELYNDYRFGRKK